MSRDFQPDFDLVKNMLDNMKTFILENNKSLDFAQYYIPLGTKTFIQILEETLNDYITDSSQIKEQISNLENVLESMRNTYIKLSSYDDFEALNLKRNIDELTQYMGFSAEGETGVFSGLENLINLLKQRETEL